MQSEVWRFFSKGTEKTVCLLCEWGGPNDKTGSTSNLWSHLASAHNMPQAAVKKLPFNNGPGGGIKTFFKPTSKAELKLACCMLVCVDLRPLSVVCGEGSLFSLGILSA